MEKLISPSPDQTLTLLATGIEEIIQLLKAKPASNDLLSQEQAARILGVKPQTMAAWRHRSEGPVYFKIGTLAKYRLADLENFIDQQKVGA
jgi:hypothetical protein